MSSKSQQPTKLATAAGRSEEEGRMKSLHELCIEAIMSSKMYMSVNGLATLYQTIDMNHRSNGKLQYFISKQLQSMYPMLREQYGLEELQKLLSEDDLKSWEANYVQFIDAKKRYASLKGTILEPEAVDLSTIRCEEGCYPLEALLSGKKWPENVDVAKREQYLSDADFVNTFQMTKGEFAQLPRFKRDQLKKEKRLF